MAIYHLHAKVIQRSKGQDEFVIYQALYGDQLLLARPISLFYEKVLYDSQEVPRFKFLCESK